MSLMLRVPWLASSFCVCHDSHVRTLMLWVAWFLCKGCHNCWFDVHRRGLWLVRRRAMKKKESFRKRWLNTSRRGRFQVTYCSTLQYTAAHGSTRQHTATNYNTLQHTAAHCSSLQRTAAHGNTRQHATTHCKILQHTRTHCNTP